MEVKIGSIRATYDYRGEKATLLCPPHPMMGGNRFDARLERISEKLAAIGISSLRFDYVDYKGGLREINDAKRCIEFLRERHTRVAILGYSFGSVVASNVADLCELAIYISPLPSIDSITFVDVKKPKLFIIAKRDEFIPLAKSFELYSRASKPKDFVVFDTDHFYSGKFDVLAERVCDFISRLL
ncbi:MAG: alpha/beta hydrolase [Archaeoglobaceae archaeon]